MAEEQEVELPEVLMARQPIYDSNLKVFAYELLFRNSDANQAFILDGSHATCRVLINAYTGFRDDNSSEQVPAFVNLTRSLLLSGQELPLPKERIVIEILEDIKIDQELIVHVQKLVDSGYQVALDDFILAEEYRPLLKIVQFIKIDIRQLTPRQLKEHVTELKNYPKLKLLAEKVETEEEYEYCRNLGFDYYQGYFLDKPQIIKGKAVSSSTHVVMNLLKALQDESATAETIAEIIGQDAALTFKLLRVINSAAFTIANKIESVPQAVMMLGFKQIQSWAMIISLANANNRPPEVMNKLLIRAGTCERYAKYTQHSSGDSYFIVGLFSGLDTLLGIKLPEILSQLPLSEEVKSSILNYEGEAGEVLKIVLAFEEGDWELLGKKHISGKQLNHAYTESIAWAKASMEAI